MRNHHPAVEQPLHHHVPALAVIILVFGIHHNEPACLGVLDGVRMASSKWLAMLRTSRACVALLRLPHTLLRHMTTPSMFQKSVAGKALHVNLRMHAFSGSCIDCVCGLQGLCSQDCIIELQSTRKFACSYSRS